MIYRNKEWLQEKYWGKDLNISQIGELAGVCTATILYWMNKHNIPRRSMSEVQRGEKNHMWGRRGEKCPHWKGGRKYDGNGYILIWNPDHPNAGKAGYVREHRLVMAEHLGRPLEPYEIVHHINGIKDDNRMENLELLPRQAEHLSLQKLQAENLKWQRAFYKAVGCWLGEREREHVQTTA